MSEKNTESPKTFISYSWTSPEHEAWVLQLATELDEESGVHVIIDKWDLREGADKYAYMEKMVTDPSVRKVVVICDRLYTEKADARKGGVGTETQIISQELYEQVDPTDQKQKFVAVITEKDEGGKSYIPTFLRSRIYIDMSDPTEYDAGLDQLIRWIYDKPIHKRPERGKPPTYLSADEKVSLGTGSRFRRADAAVRQDKPLAVGAIRDYFDTFAENLETFRMEEEQGKELDDQVVESIEAFLPYRDEATDLFLVIARYRSDPEPYEAIHRFFEQILPYGFRPAGLSTWNKVLADNFKFILNELFLYAVAALLKNGRFEQANLLVERGYYFSERSPDIDTPGLVPFTLFWGYLESLERRKNRLKLNQLSIMSDLLKQRAKRPDLTFDDIQQADLVLFLRDELRDKENNYPYMYWIPHTLLYTTYHRYPYEIFARAQSKTYFNQIKVALGVTSKDQLVSLLNEYTSRERQLPRWQANSFSPSVLMDIDNLATQP